jgi:hypothetical protein
MFIGDEEANVPTPEMKVASGIHIVRQTTSMNL